MFSSARRHGGGGYYLFGIVDERCAMSTHLMTQRIDTSNSHVQVHFTFEAGTIGVSTCRCPSRAEP